jgi:[protein-PII] uridylyltransferase
MVGIFTSSNVQVLSASIATLKNGLAFDIYRVTNPVDPLREKEVWAKIRDEAEKAVAEGDEFDADLEDRLIRRVGLPEGRKAWIRTVRIDNDATDFFTCIEVYALHRRGFLYLLAKRLFALDLNIRFAKVHSDKEKITGIFHVRDNRGQRIQDEERIGVIRESILSLAS